MKKTITLIYILFIGSFFSVAQNTTTNFLQWHIQEYNFSKTLFHEINQWTSQEINLLTSENSPYHTQLSELFSENDLMELQKSIVINQNLSWDKELLKTLDVKIVKTKVEKMDNESAFWSYSEPVFLNNFCVLKLDFICGATCRNSQIIVFEKQDETTWKQVIEFAPIQTDLLSAY